MDSTKSPRPTSSPHLLAFVVAAGFIVAATGLAVSLFGDRVDDADSDTEASRPVGADLAADVIDYGSEVDIGAVGDPYAAGEELPHGYFQIYSRDIILPVYAPRFASASAIGWPDDADVIGVAVNGEAKAYPVSFLNGREMVIDELGGEPLLVSW